MRLALNDKKKGIGFSYAWKGIVQAAKHERNFRIHLAAAFAVVLAGFVFSLNTIEWAVILLAIGMVLAAELLNSAVEKLIDYLKPELHPLAGTIKDVAAGSVLITAITAALIGIIVFLPKLHILG